MPQLVAPGPGDRLVGDPSLRTAAQEVAAEMAAMPHPRELVPVLERLAGVSRPAA